jgi:hypothetical protein
MQERNTFTAPPKTRGKKNTALNPQRMRTGNQGQAIAKKMKYIFPTFH